MNAKICYIFAAGDFSGNLSKNGDDLIIAADAGYHHLKKIGIEADILLGDFDTIGTLPEHENIISFPPEKDYTDTELAIMEGIKQGFNRFIICGALGGKRLEHTVANLSLAASYSQRGYDITLTDGNYYAKALTDGTFTFTGGERGFVSVFSISGKAEGVSEQNLKYGLENALLDASNPTLCVSNEFIGKQASISVKHGTVIIIWQNSKN